MTINCGMILAAGVGSRLGTITRTMPKALVKVDGFPVLQRVILHMRDSGITRIVVNVHHFANQITDFLALNDNFGMDIVISDETDELLDTGGALVKAAPLFAGADNIVVHNVDILSNADLRHLIAVHDDEGSVATLFVNNRATSRYLLFDEGMNLCGWENIKSGETIPAALPTEQLSRFAFTGIHVLKPSLIQHLTRYTEKKAFSIIPFYANNCSSMPIKGLLYDSRCYWFDIGSPEKLEKADNFFKETNR